MKKFIMLVACWSALMVTAHAKTIAVTNSDTALTIIMDGGSAVKKLAAGVEVEILQEDGDNWRVKDANGALGLVPKAALTVRENAGASPSAAAQTPAALTVSDTNTAATAATPAADSDTVAKLNQAFEMELFADADLWQNDAAAVAKRLKWSQESLTETQSSYRLYAKPDARVLGARPYSLALYARDGKPETVSMVFANKGDFEGVDKKSDDKKRAAAIRDFKDAVKEDAKTIADTLTVALGEPRRQTFGETPETRESVSRWDWGEHAILLASPKDEYAAVRIVRKDVADNFGRAARVSGLREMLPARVIKRDNGDVIVSQIPMVNQGPKGYCVPATWERYLRYMEIPADMYLLAMAGNTNLGGGTYIDELTANVDLYVRRYGCKIQTVDGGVDVRNVAKYIDKGLPLMWACYSERHGGKKHQPTRERAGEG